MWIVVGTAFKNIKTVGVFLFLTGAAGGWPYFQLQIQELGWRIALASLGVITSGIGGLLIWRTRTSNEADKYFRKNDFILCISGLCIEF